MLYYTDNPVWPFLGQVFGYGPWTPDDYRSYIDSMHLGAPGVRRDVVGLISLPWALANESISYQNSVFQNFFRIIGWLHVAFIPAFLIALRDPRTHVLFLLMGASLLFWFFSVQDTRYLLPTLPVFSLLLGASLDRCAAWLGAGRQKLIEPALHCFMAVALVNVVAVPIARELSMRGSPPTTPVARAEYLSTHLPSYRAVSWLNENAGSYRAYQLYTEGMMYFFDGEVIGDWFGPGRYTDVLRAARSGQTLHDKLRALGVTHLLVNTQTNAVALPNDAVFREKFTPIYNVDNLAIYALHDV